jgi:hypothetical protein
MMTKRRYMKNLLTIVLCLSLFGCASLTSTNMDKSFVEPQYGMTRMQLVDSIGKPQSIEIYKKSDQTQVEYYIYIRQYQSSQLKIPICLMDNKVVGWGKTYYEDHISADDVRIK